MVDWLRLCFCFTGQDSLSSGVHPNVGNKGLKNRDTKEVTADKLKDSMKHSKRIVEGSHLILLYFAVITYLDYLLCVVLVFFFFCLFFFFCSLTIFIIIMQISMGFSISHESCFRSLLVSQLRLVTMLSRCLCNNCHMPLSCLLYIGQMSLQASQYSIWSIWQRLSSLLPCPFFWCLISAEWPGRWGQLFISFSVIPVRNWTRDHLLHTTTATKITLGVISPHGLRYDDTCWGLHALYSLRLSHSKPHNMIICTQALHMVHMNCPNRISYQHSLKVRALWMIVSVHEHPCLDEEWHSTVKVRTSIL